MNLLFEARNITKQFANHKALDEVSISVPEQSIFGLLGPNGAGKTTLIRIINQITAPDSGNLLLRNKKLEARDVYKIGYLPEERGLYKKMKVGEQALYLARLKGLSKSDALKKLRYWFEKFEIQGWWNKKVEELSKGMQQKVQFIVTIIHEPELLIFDEPFSGFDPINVNLLKEEILKLRDNGATIIFSTHNMASVEELCDHIALIDRSKKILDGKVLDIRNKFKSNTYEISFNGFNGDLNSILGNNYNLIESRDDDELQTVRIRIVNGNKPNDLIKLLLPHVNFNSINEILPTMNDIFISKVQENE
ncbi:MAG: ABC transporter ATP-binding protein [Bacteroidetes bacterium 4484_249]|nr:MAG: ABC transporter ATP-binding protein [Bacteroidetes bacterium 4484_249]